MMLAVIARTAVLDALRRALSRTAIVVLTGPRQCGKTTLARELLSEDHVNYFDLEDPASLARLDEPMTALRSLAGLVVIDEVQRRPDLFPVLRVLADARQRTARFLILGSATGELLRQSSESLAGRVEHVGIGGFSLGELGADAARALWLRGAFPRSYLARSETDSVAWRRHLIQMLLERDLPQWGVRVPAVSLRRFWTMLAHYHAQTWNAAEPARALGVSGLTSRRYLDLLTDALMVRQLRPWHANLSKRQVKSPKVYVRDSGLLHELLGIDSEHALVSHPKVGASWEGFVIEQVLATEPHDEAFFWATHQGAEVDLILRRGDRLLGVECKRADAPKVTRSIRTALEDLGLERVAVIHPGPQRHPLAERVEAVPLASLASPGTLFDEARHSTPGALAADGSPSSAGGRAPRSPRGER
jgi:predicted AAA+ superfamily ATPase